jgi:hypothetical protein
VWNDEGLGVCSSVLSLQLLWGWAPAQGTAGESAHCSGGLPGHRSSCPQCPEASWPSHRQWRWSSVTKAPLTLPTSLGTVSLPAGGCWPGQTECEHAHVCSQVLQLPCMLQLVPLLQPATLVVATTGLPAQAERQGRGLHRTSA